MTHENSVRPIRNATTPATSPDHDDTPNGVLLTRKQAMSILAGAGACMLVGRTAFGQTDTCVVRPALTVGPYYVDSALERSDIRYDPADGTTKYGVSLNITFAVTQVINGSCVPLEGALVELWHCDAEGLYSGVSDPGFDTAGLQFLRGYQVSDANGMVNFTTIYPGWYRGRAVHIHFKIRTANNHGDEVEFTSQLFFNDIVTSEVHDVAPYNNYGTRDTLNIADSIYVNGGDQLLLDLAGSPANGYLSVFNIALELDALNSGDTIADLTGAACTAPAATTARTAISNIGTLSALAGILALFRSPGPDT